MCTKLPGNRPVLWPYRGQIHENVAPFGGNYSPLPENFFMKLSHGRILLVWHLIKL